MRLGTVFPRSPRTSTWCATPSSAWCPTTTSSALGTTTGQGCAAGNKETKRCVLARLSPVHHRRLLAFCCDCVTHHFLSSRPVPSLRPSTSACPREAPTALPRNSGCRSPSSVDTTQSAGEFGLSRSTKSESVICKESSQGLKII